MRTLLAGILLLAVTGSVEAQYPSVSRIRYEALVEWTHPDGRVIRNWVPSETVVYFPFLPVLRPPAGAVYDVLLPVGGQPIKRLYVGQYRDVP